MKRPPGGSENCDTTNRNHDPKHLNIRHQWPMPSLPGNAVRTTIGDERIPPADWQPPPEASPSQPQMPPSSRSARRYDDTCALARLPTGSDTSASPGGLVARATEGRRELGRPTRECSRSLLGLTQVAFVRIAVSPRCRSRQASRPVASSHDKAELSLGDQRGSTPAAFPPSHAARGHSRLRSRLGERRWERRTKRK
jgi:hypothetical protein